MSKSWSYTTAAKNDLFRLNAFSETTTKLQYSRLEYVQYSRHSTRMRVAYILPRPPQLACDEVFACLSSIDFILFDHDDVLIASSHDGVQEETPNSKSNSFKLQRQGAAPEGYYEAFLLR